MEEIKKTESDIDSFDILDQLDEESSFNFRAILRLFILNWQWFLISMFIFACRYTDPVYQMSAKMLIKEESSNRRSNGQILANMQDLGFVSNSTGIENEGDTQVARPLARGSKRPQVIRRVPPRGKDQEVAHIQEPAH